MKTYQNEINGQQYLEFNSKSDAIEFENQNGIGFWAITRKRDGERKENIWLDGYYGVVQAWDKLKEFADEDGEELESNELSYRHDVYTYEIIRSI